MTRLARWVTPACLTVTAMGVLLFGIGAAIGSESMRGTSLAVIVIGVLLTIAWPFYRRFTKLEQTTARLEQVTTAERDELHNENAWLRERVNELENPRPTVVDMTALAAEPFDEHAANPDGEPGQHRRKRHLILIPGGAVATLIVSAAQSATTAVKARAVPIVTAAGVSLAVAATVPVVLLSGLIGGSGGANQSLPLAFAEGVFTPSGAPLATPTPDDNTVTDEPPMPTESPDPTSSPEIIDAAGELPGPMVPPLGDEGDDSDDPPIDGDDGGSTPTATPEPTGEPTSSPSPSPSGGPTPSPSPTSTPTPSASPTPTTTPTPTATPTPTHSPTPTPSPTPSPTQTPSPTPTPTETPTDDKCPPGYTLIDTIFGLLCILLSGGDV